MGTVRQTAQRNSGAGAARAWDISSPDAIMFHQDMWRRPLRLEVIEEVLQSISSRHSRRRSSRYSSSNDNNSSNGSNSWAHVPR